MDRKCTMMFYTLFVVVGGLNCVFSKETMEKIVSQLIVKVEDLGTYLVDLDQKILRMLILPEKGGGDQLLECLEKFWKNFRHLDGLVVLSEQEAFRPAKYMLEQECPKFVQEAFDVLNLQQTYGWDAVQFSTFREYLILISGLSAKFPDDFSKMRVDVETLLQKPLQQQV
uniref:Uncharacterized protein n=1 Tax=Homalodisca liturata TaxID=320908 RepID=A0A1B6JC10_9HEMI